MDDMEIWEPTEVESAVMDALRAVAEKHKTHSFAFVYASKSDPLDHGVFQTEGFDLRSLHALVSNLKQTSDDLKGQIDDLLDDDETPYGRLP